MVLKRARGSAGYGGLADNERVLRHLAKVTINPAITHGLSHDVGALTPGRVAYFCHRDWVSHARPPADVWAPQEETPIALAATAQWYRAQGSL